MVCFIQKQKQIIPFDPEWNVVNGTTNYNNTFKVKNIFITPKYAKTFWKFKVKFKSVYFWIDINKEFEFGCKYRFSYCEILNQNNKIDEKMESSYFAISI